MNQKRSQSLQTLCVLLIFCLFTISSLFLVLIGANVYQGVSRKMSDNNQIRATLSYVANKIRTGDEAGSVITETRGDVDALIITAVYDGDAYHTYLYWYDGALKEQFLGSEEEFLPENGDEITPIPSFSIEQQGQAVTISAAADNGRAQSLTVALRTEVTS